ncbi:MAG: hypothetical protein ABWZ63_11710 [Thermoleophilaceae bacterium]
METTLLIRSARPQDAAHLFRLASLDDARSINSDNALVAEFGGEIVAAIDVSERRAIADPFRRTSSYVELLQMRAEQLEPVDAPVVALPAHAHRANAYA